MRRKQKSRIREMRDWVIEKDLINFARDYPLEVFAAVLSCTSLIVAILVLVLDGQS